MPLFTIAKTTLSPVDQMNFAAEESLQGLIEQNLESVFGCRFVATEFSTGVHHRPEPAPAPHHIQPKHHYINHIQRKREHRTGCSIYQRQQSAMSLHH